MKPTRNQRENDLPPSEVGAQQTVRQSHPPCHPLPHCDDRPTQKCICPASLRSRGEQAVALFVQFSAAIKHALRFVKCAVGPCAKLRRQRYHMHHATVWYSKHFTKAKDTPEMPCRRRHRCRNDCSDRVSSRQLFIPGLANNSLPWGIVSAPQHPKYTLALHAICPPPPPVVRKC